jgi:hypothetical protein
MRARVDKLEHVTKLNVWGNELEDVAIVGAMPNLQVLALSVNKIATLKDFQYCYSLKELYLRKNLICDLGELRYLQQLPALQVLWLLENPCAELPNYRLRIIKALPSLTKLDDNEVTAEERNRADLCRDELGGPKDQRRPPPQAQPAREVQPARQEPQVASRPPPSQAPREPLVQREAPPKAVERAPARRHSMNESPTQQESAFDGRQTEVPTEASENVLCAVMALIQDLDAKGLTLVRRECDRKLRTCS